MKSKKKFQKNKLPVFLISGKSPVTKPGGYAAYSHNLAKVFIKLGHKVYIIAQGDKNNITKTKIGDEHLVNSSLIDKLPFFKSLELAALPFFSYLFVKEIEKIIVKNKIDKFIVWGAGPWSYAGVSIKNKFKNRVKFIVSYFTTFPHEMRGSYNAINVADYGFVTKLKYFVVLNVVAKMYARLENSIVHTCDIVACHYNSTKKILKKEFSLPNKKMNKIAYYVEIFQRNDKKTKEDLKLEKSLSKVFKTKKTLVIICRQDPRKGINFLLRAFKTVREKTDNIKLIMVGSGSMFKSNQKLAKKLGISSDVIFTGFVSDFKTILKKSDVFVFPAVEEGSGSLSILEAMKEGKAIITTKCDGIPEDIVNRKDGILVPMLDEHSLSDAILEVINNPKLIKKLGNNAKKAYISKFSFDYMKKDVEKLLSTI
ncbi:glycosyltransferase family 4 protein [Candidatus Microgenomates bacterium]|nr:glycosyltransferase family 4 protein [Candidatus Microgenomates bacterium]